MQTPLIAFINLLVQAAILKSQNIFNILMEKFKNVYTRDPMFKKLLTKIGVVVFGL